MCGISGIFSLSYPFSDDKIINYKNILLKSLNHRGPDSNGYYVSKNRKLLLTHNRLSIIDISQNAAQPMISENKNYIISFNGEIYNHTNLKKSYFKTSKTNWLTHSDTKTLLELFSEFGIENTLSKVNGMYGISLYNEIENKLFLIRDRFGEKPLYYGFADNYFVFSSEISSIKKLPFFKNILNKEILNQFLYSNNIPHPHSVYKNIYKLSPGCYIEIDLNKLSKVIQLKEKKYWDPREFYINPNKNNIKSEINLLQYSNKLENILNYKIKDELISDVEIGSFLSGGIDSSLISLIAHNQYKNFKEGKLNTFSIGYHDPNYDESERAKAIADYIGTNHNQLIINPNDALEIINKIPDIYSEPFGDSSQIPTYILSRFAKKYINVALTGDGGDEIFGGYNRYIFSLKYWPYLKKIPLQSRKFLKTIYDSIPESLLLYLISFFSSNYNIKDIKNKVQKFINSLDAPDDKSLYATLIGFENSGNNSQAFTDKIFFENNNFLNTAEKFMLNDILYYLPNDVLCKVDRAAMSNSLETRCPFLDHEVYEYSLTIPFKYKISNKNNSKYILKNILSKYLPNNLFINNKMGFAIPLNDWLKGPLKEWSYDLINNSVICEYTDIDKKLVKKKWKNFLDGNSIYSNFIWNFLILEQWISNDNNL